MSDQEHNKDPLERLFREKANEYDIEYEEKDWLKLKDRLDAADRQRKRTRRRRWIAAAVILAFAFLTYVTVENQLQINRLKEKLSEYQTGEQEQPTRIEKNERNNKEEPHPAMEGKSPVDKSNTTKKASPNLAASNDTTDNNNATSSPNRQQKNRSRQNITSALELQAIAVEQKLSKEDMYPDAALSDVRSLKTKNVRPKPSSGTPHNTKKIAAINVKSEPRNFSRVSLGLLMGPDLSTAGSLSNFHDPGYEMGITVDYNLSPKWGISAGIIRSRVRYTARGKEYEPPRAFLSPENLPRQTVGDCVLLDIPLRLKYNFPDRKGGRFYATAGISSYIMLNEKYRFNYSNNYQTNRAQSWSGKTGTRHWMSNASLSVGYEYDILRSWSLRAEPYLKIPLKEVGWGNVKLYSMGMTFSLNYKL